jgi:RNA recognition motif-containing protein
MEAKLYVGNLAYSVTEEDLRTLFAQAGTVKDATIIKDRETRRSKGFGFVEMESPAEAEAAISMFNGNEFQGRSGGRSNSRQGGNRPRNDNRDRNSY